jgi:hypothetical protein
MTRPQAWSLHVSTLLVGLTGIVYGYMRYCAQPEDPYSLVNHPWQPALRDAHILLAPLMVFSVGWIWQDHVWKRVRTGFRRRRRSGWALFALAGPMVLSGYLLQVAAEPCWRNVWIVLHVGGSGLWIAVYLVHPWLPRGGGRAGALRAAAAPASPGGTPDPLAKAPPPGGASRPADGAGGRAPS